MEPDFNVMSLGLKKDDYIAGFPPHPSLEGIETVTYMLSGEFTKIAPEQRVLWPQEMCNG